MIETQNQLETLMQQAAEDPAYRPAFYRALLDAELITLGTVTDEQKISMIQWHLKGGVAIPVFTSVEAANQAVKPGQNLINFEARTLFDNTIGQTLLLNPNSDYGKELLPEEIQALIDGSIFDQLTHTTAHFSEDDMQLIEPTSDCDLLKRKLVHLFEQHAIVDFAYIAQVKHAKTPRLIIALEGEADAIPVITDAALLVESLKLQDVVVDFMIMQEADALTEKISTFEPFYCRFSLH